MGKLTNQNKIEDADRKVCFQTEIELLIYSLVQRTEDTEGVNEYWTYKQTDKQTNRKTTVEINADSVDLTPVAKRLNACPLPQSNSVPP